MDFEKEYKRKALEPIVNYIESVLASYSKEELEARIKEALPKKESEDERIRNDIMEAVENRLPYERVEEIRYYLEKHKLSADEVLIKAGLKPYKDGNQWCILIGDNIQDGICGFGDTIDDALYHLLREAIAYQKEQKPAEWSEEDSNTCNNIIARLESFIQYERQCVYRDYLEKEIKWLKERLPLLKPKQEISAVIDRQLWKPSEEQIEALENSTALNEEQGAHLYSLLCDLKKLM